MKKMVKGLIALGCFTCGTLAYAAISGVGSVAAQVTQQFGAVAQFITALSYIAGMAFVVGAIVKFKTHKDNPTQVTIGMPIALLFVGAALIFVPTVFKVSGSTLFGGSAKVAGVSGITDFGGVKPTT